MQVQQNPEISYSAKHSGLYLYITRLLRPIWKKRCIVLPQCTSSINELDCAQILEDLYATRAFLENLPVSNVSGKSTSVKTSRNKILMNFDVSGFSQNGTIFNSNYNQGNTTASQQRATLEQAYNEEKKSTKALISLISKLQHIASIELHSNENSLQNIQPRSWPCGKSCASINSICCLHRCRLKNKTCWQLACSGI